MQLDNIYNTRQPSDGLTEHQVHQKVPNCVWNKSNQDGGGRGNGGSWRFFAVILNTVFLYLFLDMVQLEQYEANPSVSVEPDGNVEVNFHFYYYWLPVKIWLIGRRYGLRLKK